MCQISVIITTYNRKVDILARAIDSVINQTFNDIEILVINDNPKDKYHEKEIISMISMYNNKRI